MSEVITASENQYCSWCYEKTTHHLVKVEKIGRNLFQCEACKNYTATCRFCDNMVKAIERDDLHQKWKWTNERCAEHDGTIFSFSEPPNNSLNNLASYRDVLRHKNTKSLSLTKIGKFLLADYFADDEKFELIHLTHTTDSSIPSKKVILINGFLQEKDQFFEDWKASYQLIKENVELFGLTWASKRVDDVMKTFSIPSLVSRKLFWANIAYNVATNPWHVSLKRAQDAGELLGNILLKMDLDAEPITLVAHSLGCRVIFYALHFLQYHPHIKVNNVYLLGGAVGNQKQEWEAVLQAISGKIYNCYSTNDEVLHKGYSASTLNLSKAVGYYPIKSDNDRIQDIDCTTVIQSHTDWKEKYPEVYQRILSNS